MIRLLLLLTLLLTALPSLAQTGARAGVAAAVRGPVVFDRGSEVGRSLSSGDPIYLGDVIRTGDKGGLQVMLLDETVFTLGPQSQMIVDEFVYNPEKKGGRLDVTLAKGVFRFVTGKIARDEPENVELKLPVGSIGIRGTIGAAKIEGDESLVALFGPGPLNDADERTGGLVVRGAKGKRELLTPGWGVKVGPEGPPSAPFGVAPATFAELGPRGRFPAGIRRPRPHRGSARPEQRAGAVRRGGRTASEGTETVSHTSSAVNNLNLSALQTLDEESVAEFVPALAFNGLSNFPDGITQVQELIQRAGVSNEVLRWKAMGAPINPPHFGTFDTEVFVDFGLRDVAFKFNNLASSTYATGGFGTGFLKSKPFAAGINGDARFVVTGFYDESPSSLCVPCTVTLNAEFRNKFNLPARDGTLFIVIKDTTGSVISTAGPFVGGPTLISP